MFGKILNLLWHFNVSGHICFAVNGQIVHKYSSYLFTLVVAQWLEHLSQVSNDVCSMPHLTTIKDNIIDFNLGNDNSKLVRIHFTKSGHTVYHICHF